MPKRLTARTLRNYDVPEADHRSVRRRLDGRLRTLRRQRRASVQEPSLLERRHVRRWLAPYGGWLFPESVVERLAPDAASGGAIGPDGWLYLLGHDRPEMYVVARPSMGPTMIHIATIDLEAEGQALSWAQDGSRRVFTIDRRKHLVRTIEVPSIQAPATRDARPFRPNAERR